MPQIDPDKVAHDGQWAGMCVKADKEPWQVVFWNVRNITGKMGRAGVTGRGVPLEMRVHQIAQMTALWNPDVLLIMEAGADGDVVAEFLQNELTGHVVEASGQTGTETYIAVLSKRADACKKNFAIYGTKREKYRQPVGLTMEVGVGEKIALFALHAPSPSYSLKERLKTIEHYAKAAANDKALADHSLLFMGDLNVKGKEFDHLGQMMKGLGYVHLGPRKDSTPLPTSIRKFTTIIKTDGETDSEPYDQAWGRPGPKKVNIPACFTFLPKMSIPSLSTKFPKWLVASVKETLVDDVPAVHYASKQFPIPAPSADIRTANELLAQYLEERAFARELYLQFFSQKGNERYGFAQLFSEDLKTSIAVNHELMAAVDARLRQPVVNVNIIDVTQHKRIAEDTVGAACDFVTTLLRAVIPTIGTANAYFRVLTSGKQGVGVTDANAFEFAISDHRPVAVAFHF